MKYYVLIHSDDDSRYWGECPELPGCFSQGDTPAQLMEHMKEAMELYLDDNDTFSAERISEIRELVVS